MLLPFHPHFLQRKEQETSEGTSTRGPTRDRRYNMTYTALPAHHRVIATATPFSALGYRAHGLETFQLTNFARAVAFHSVLREGAGWRWKVEADTEEVADQTSFNFPC